MKTALYWLLSAQSFVQLKNDTVFGISNLFVVMSILSFIAAIPIGLGLDYGASFPYIIPFILVGLLFVTSKWTLGVVSKEIQAKYWRTQLVRFKDPNFEMQRMLYPGRADQRELQLERMWFAEYGVEFDNTKAPAIQKYRIFLLLIMAGLGLLFGMVL